MQSTHLSCYLFAAIMALFISACNEQTPASAERLGEIHIEVSGAAEAVPHFRKGLLLLHSFEYEDAREAFLAAQAADSGFAMAYWGEAMTHNHNIWHQQDREKGLAALQKLAPTPEARLEMAPTPLEKSLMQSANILFGEGSKYERDLAYRDYLAELYQQYPQNHEVAAFYALSLLGAVQEGRNEAEYEKSARIAKGILQENPRHPGALHYLIHSYDDPYHARFALQAADSYAQVAPDAAHALHMPSHIYVAMGMWKEVVASNEASYLASVNRMQAKGLDHDARSYHALHWLMYGYLQQGRYAACNQIMQNMQQYVAEKPSKRARAYLVGMKATYLVETEDWDHEVADIVADVSDLNIALRTKYDFLTAMKAWQQGDTARMHSLIKEMETARQAAAIKASDKALAQCNAGGWTSDVSQINVDQAEVMILELRALLAGLQGRAAQAESWFQTATQLEESISYAYGPPIICKPSHELYGQWLLQQNRPQEALAQFEKALERGPKRVLALRGKKEAATQLGQHELATNTDQLLQQIQSPAASPPISL